MANNAANGNPLNNQPNLQRFSEGHRAVYEESLKFPNLPAVDNDAAILEAIHNLTGIVERGFQKINHLQQNNAARVQNSYVTSPTEPLSPFINPTTGHDIDGFPDTPAAIHQMPPQQLTAVLRALEQDLNGGRREKEMRLRAHIGLRRQPRPGV